MKTRITALLAALLVVGIMAPASAVEADYTLDITDKAPNNSAEYTSEMFAGIAPGFFLGGTAGPEYTCGDPVENCDYALISIEGISQEEIDAALAEGEALADLKDTVNYSIGITEYSVPASDLDIIIYESNAAGDKLGELGRVGDLDTDPSEEYSSSFKATGENPVGYFLMEVVHFAGAGTYKGYASAF